MSNDRRGDVGKVIIGCAVVAIVGVLICGGVVSYLGPKLFERGIAALEKEMERQQVLEDWNPPAEDATADELFPIQVGAASRSVDPDEARIPNVNVQRTFRHSEYVSGDTTFDVYLDQISADERTLIFGELKQMVDDREGGLKFSFGTENSNSFFYHIESPPESGSAYYTNGWLILAFSDGTGELLSTFMQEYTDAIEGEPANVPEPSDDEPIDPTMTEEPTDASTSEPNDESTPPVPAPSGDAPPSVPLPDATDEESEE